MKIDKIVLPIICFMNFVCFGQSEWEVFSNAHWVHDITVQDGKAYVPNSGGLLVIDQQTNQEEFITTANTALNGTDIRQILMLDNGHFWLHYSRTLYYNDGDKFEIHLDSFSIWNMVVQDDDLWFRGRDLTLQNSSTKLYSLIDGILQEYDTDFPEGVRRIFVDSNDDLWIQVDDYIAVYDGEDVLNKITIQGLDLNSESIWRYYIDKRQNHWFCVSEGNNRFKILSLSDGIWNSYHIDVDIVFFENLFEFENTDIIFTTEDLIGIIKDDILTLDSIKYLLPKNNGEYSKIDLHHIENDSIMWLSSSNVMDPAQIFRVNSTETIVYGRDNQFLTAFPQAIQKDCDNAIYCLDGDSAVKYDGQWSPSAYVGESDKCLGYRCLTYNPSTCHVWAYSDLSDCSVIWNLNLNSIIELDIPNDDGCDIMSFDSEGRLYAACGGILYKIDSLGGSEIFLENVTTISFTIGKSDNIWVIGSPDNSTLKLYEYKNMIWENYEFANLQSFSFLFEDSDGLLWSRTEDGICSFDGISFTEYDLGGFPLWNMVEDKNGNYWFSSNEGLVFWDKENLVKYNIWNSDIQSNSPRDLMIIDDQLWMQHPSGAGISKMKIDGLDTSIESLENPMSDYSVYPNPSNGEIFIQNNELLETKIEVFSISGELIDTFSSNNNRFEITIDDGFYLLRLTNSKYEVIKKVIVQR